MKSKSFYLFARRVGREGRASESVFFKTEREDVAKHLCGLFKKEYGKADEGTEFRYAAADSIAAHKQVLLDESLGWLEVYDDPDPGVYDPEPDRKTMALAQYGVRARAWEKLLREAAAKANAAGEEKGAAGGGSEPLASAGMDGMSEEERRNVMLGLLMLLSQAYYRILESAIGMASTVTALDLELNHSYLWTVKNLRNLLANSPELKDFPEQFKPAVPNLYPSTIQDVEWDWIRHEAEGFLSAVQEYTMDKGMYEPEEKSPAWIMIELFRPGVEKAVERAAAYQERMSAAWRKMMAGVAQGASGRAAPGTPKAESPSPVPATGVTTPSTSAPAPPDFVRGRLRCSAGFKDVRVGDDLYDLRARKKASLCIQYLFENSAFDAASAKHLVDDIDPFVRKHSGCPPSVDIKIQHYFNSQRGKMRELCKKLIGGVHGKGRYFLKVD